MRRSIAILLLWIVPLVLSAQQTDTSSFFPLGLWGIWLESNDPPLNGGYVGKGWHQEVVNLQRIKANYLVFGMPVQVEDTLVMIADTIQYKVGIGNNDYVTHDPNSLLWWLRAGKLSDSADAIRIIRLIKKKYNSHPSFYSYQLDDEGSMDQPSRWPLIEFVAQKIHELDPQRRSFGSTGPVPPQIFFDEIPHLDVFQFDQYPFFSIHPPIYSGQQTALDRHLIGPYNDLMNRLRGKWTEWQAIIQSQEDVRPFGEINLRRPNFYELRVQAYLALSRGARGILYYAYGSSKPKGDGEWGTDGLVDINPTTGDREKWEDIHHGKNTTPAFDNVSRLNSELRRIGPTIRKLRVYDAFPHTSIPFDNIAHIRTVKSDYYFGPRFEVGTFKRIDRGVDSTVYFLLVNRVCNNDDGSVSPQQNFSITFSNEMPLVITEVVSGKKYNLPRWGILTDVISPGEGKLYEIAK
ncbi:MAG TPA: hypothetical protein VMM58_07070 [Bacteroidota bacterium]|nr:hypothetical protein [Bacteroidota bacterium]